MRNERKLLKSNEGGTEELFSDSKKAAKPSNKSELKSSDACCLCGIGFKFSDGDFAGMNKYFSTENLSKIPLGD